MEPLFNINGLMFWNEREIRLRRQFEAHFAAEMQTILMAENPAWRFIQFEGPQLTPRVLLNPNYTEDDIWLQEIDEEEFFASEHGALALRPETTPSSYVYAQHLLRTHSGIKPPFVVWQTGKSFRREQEQVTKNMRLKEFYQQEFQCIYTTETKNDYQEAVLEPVRKMIGEMVGLPTRLVESDRLPSYSLRTMDVEAWLSEPGPGPFEARVACENDPPPHHYHGRWMELCSISKRTDFPDKARFETKKGIVEKDLEVLEVAIGLDRVVYNFEQKGENDE